MPNTGRSRLEELADRGDRVVAGLRVARAVGQEDAVGVERQHVGRAGLRGDDGDATAVVREQPQDVALDAEVVGDHVQARARPQHRAPVRDRCCLRSTGTALARTRPWRGPCPSGPGRRAPHAARRRRRPGRRWRCSRPGRPLAQDPRELARVDACDGDRLRLRRGTRDSEWLARQLEWRSGRSRITRPAAWMESDSRSSGVTPVLPMCG